MRNMTNLEIVQEIVRRFDTLTLQGMRNWETAMGMEQLLLQLIQNLRKEGADAEGAAGK